MILKIIFAIFIGLNCVVLSYSVAQGVGSWAGAGGNGGNNNYGYGYSGIDSRGRPYGGAGGNGGFYVTDDRGVPHYGVVTDRGGSGGSGSSGSYGGYSSGEAYGSYGGIPGQASNYPGGGYSNRYYHRNAAASTSTAFYKIFILCLFLYIYVEELIVN